MSNFDDTLALAQSLTPVEKLRLIEKLSRSLEADLQSEKPLKSLYGLWADVSISAEEIEEARREMWGNFPRDDI